MFLWVIIFLVILILLLGVGIGIGFLLHWIFPAISIGIAILTGLLSTGMAVYFCINLLKSINEMEKEGEEGEIMYIPFSRSERRKVTRKKK